MPAHGPQGPEFRGDLQTEVMAAVWRLGEAQSTPGLMPRISAISSLTLAPGSMPPRPGLAPCDSLISSARIGADSTSCLSFPRSKRPFSSRHPK